MRIAQLVTIMVATHEPAGEIAVRFDGLASDAMTTTEVLATRFVAGAQVVGPASLFYPGPRFPPLAPAALESVSLAGIEPLLAAASTDDVDESGLRHTTSAVSVARDHNREPVAAAAFTEWPEHIAHMSVLTSEGHRNVGHGATVGADAATRAQAAGLLVQWRARPDASKALARRIGLDEVGAQAVLRLPDGAGAEDA